MHWILLPAWWWAVLVVAACVGTRREAKMVANPDWLRRMPFLLLVTCWVVVPLGIAWLATWTDLARLFFPRYVAVVFPAAMLFAGLCVYAVPWRWVRLTIGLLTIGVATWSSGIITQIRHDGRVTADRNEDWRGCVAWLNQQLPQTQFPVLVASGFIEADALRWAHDELLEDFCLLPVNSLYPLDVDRADMFPLPMHEPGRLDQVVEMLVVHRGGAWLIVRGNQQAGRRVAHRITMHLESSNAIGASTKWQIQESRSFGAVQVLLLTSDAASHRGAPDRAATGP